jgi:UDP-glucose 4-epimerase
MMDLPMEGQHLAAGCKGGQTMTDRIGSCLGAPSTVCVTGGAGFSGRWLVQRLIADGHHVVVLDDLSSGTQACSETPRLRFVCGSVLDRSAVESATRRADLVVHLAGLVGMRLATREREQAYRVAVEGTQMLLDRTPSGVPILMASSSAIYGLSDDGAVDESMGDSEASALTYDGGVPGYAVGKWRMEALAREADRPALCVRPFNVVGVGQVSQWGMVIPSFVTRALEGEPLTVYDDGHQTRSFGSVVTFVDCLLAVMRAPGAWGLPRRALNIGASTPTSILDLAQMVVARTGSASPIVHGPYASAFPGRTDLRSRIPQTRTLQSLIGPVSWPSIESIVDAVIGAARP